MTWLTSLFMVCLLVGTTSAELLPWTQSNQDGFGDPANVESFTPTEFNGYLYVVTFNKNIGMQIWRTFDGVTWSRVAETVDFQNIYYYTMRLFTFNNALYLFGDSQDKLPNGALPVNQGTVVFKTTDGLN